MMIIRWLFWLLCVQASECARAHCSFFSTTFSFEFEFVCMFEAANVNALLYKQLKRNKQEPKNKNTTRNNLEKA